jgi:hypothetical protein
VRLGSIIKRPSDDRVICDGQLDLG